MGFSQEMATRKLCYVIVVDGGDDGGDSRQSKPFWYTQSALQSVLQLVGCKPHHAVKISRRVFNILERENLEAFLTSTEKRFSFSDRPLFLDYDPKDAVNISKFTNQFPGKIGSDFTSKISSMDFEVYRNQVTVTVSRGKFVDIVCDAMEKYHYVGPSRQDDIVLACRLRERKESMTILLCGTSGCGKSTLSSLLASRLGITTVISTDSIRHMMRSFATEEENPLLWASTYHAGEFLDPVAIAQAKTKKEEKGICLHGLEQPCSKAERPDCSIECRFSDESPTNNFDIAKASPILYPKTEQVQSKSLAIEGYKAQSEMVIDRLAGLITIWEGRKESVVIEGVHLSLNFVMELMKKHSSIIPFLIYIANEEKHLERFAVRAKYMTLDPSKNKYVKYIRNIRTIQDYLCKRADKHLVPKVNNTNVDRSVASIHSTIFGCLKRRRLGIPFYDVVTNTVKVINEEYRKQCDTNPIGSKCMFRMIQRQGSFRRYMAFIKNDGSVAKAWPLSNGSEANLIKSCKGNNDVSVGRPIYGPMQVHQAEPVNLQFGAFGIGFLPNDIEETSNACTSKISHADMDEEAPKNPASANFPAHMDGRLKELTEESTVSESEEEQLDDEENDSSDSYEEYDDGIEGSVAELSVKSEDEYEEEKDEIRRQISAGYDISKTLHRTLSMASSTHASGRRRYSRLQSLPLRRSHSSKIKAMASPIISSDA